MFNCIFLFLLIINTSFGMPLTQNNGTINVGSSLTALASHCGNLFISNQIKSKIEECNVTSSQIDRNQILCLIFYDINNQLCAAVNSSDSTKLLINEDYTHKINEEQDVYNVCNAAKNWNVMSKTEYANIKIMDRVFKKPLICNKVCGDTTLESTDTNFYCKYYKWGWEMLNIQTNIDPAHAKNRTVVQTPPTNITVNEHKISDAISQHAINPSDTEAVVNSKVIKQVKSNKAEVNVTIPVKTEKIYSNASNTKTVVQQSSTIQFSNNANLERNSVRSESNDIHFENEAPGGIFLSNEDENSMLTGDDPVKNDETEKDNQVDKQSNGKQEAVIDNPKTKVLTDGDDTNDYQELEDKGPSDNDMGMPQGGDDSDDPKPKLNAEVKSEHNKNSKNSDIPVPNFGEAQKEYYPIQEGFTDDDDHFFPFFLTVVILVVLLYIVYHNKNRVSKVFFGLLLEGRQPGRRRDSRGHAYRRLDTLEQAMSTNTAAPPSKIIY